MYRQVNSSFRKEFEALSESGLYDALVSEFLLIRHESADIGLRQSDEAYAIIRPERVPVWSYPYEWSFGQLKDAALATLAIQKAALDRSMILRDASAYNIQFVAGRPVLIDSLSFGLYEEGMAWAAYRQFCQHFVAPLVLMSKVDVRLGRLLALNIDGIPLDLASKLSKSKTRFKPWIAVHLHMHARAQKNYEDKVVEKKRVSKQGLYGLVDSLQSLINSLTWEPKGTEWGDYYSFTNYSDQAKNDKQALVTEFLERVSPKPQLVWDLGANNGEFSELAAKMGCETAAWDIDPAAVEKCYQRCKASPIGNLTPLLLDLSNPSPAIGWANKERESLSDRGPADVVMALALIHHLSIGNNVPLSEVASYFASLGSWLIIEFVPKGDSQVTRMLATREDVFSGYTQEGFEQAFLERLELIQRAEIRGTSRILYLFKTSK